MLKPLRSPTLTYAPVNFAALMNRKSEAITGYTEDTMSLHTRRRWIAILTLTPICSIPASKTWSYARHASFLSRSIVHLEALKIFLLRITGCGGTL